MKKFLLSTSIMMVSIPMFAQVENPVTAEEIEETDIIIEETGSSIDDIINIQQQLTSNSTESKHFESVWSRKGFFNISYNSAKLEPKSNYPTGMGTNVGNFSNDWGLGIQTGRNYNLLKKPIANIVTINLDYLPLDLNVNHYKKNGSDYLFNSGVKTSDGYYYLPWNSEKYEYNYGMSLGPSVTLAPFTKLDINQLHFLKFNVYYHIGYHISLLQFKTNKSEDQSPNTYESIMDKATKLSFGHGLTNCVGFNASWKFIGIGYEMRWATLSYFSLDKKNFGSQKYKFNAPTGRVYLQFRF